MAKPWSKEPPLTAPEYARLLEDVRSIVGYHFSSLARWHVPVPWGSWSAFAVNYKPTGCEPDHTNSGDER